MFQKKLSQIFQLMKSKLIQKFRKHFGKTIKIFD